ncbi:MAG: stage IV sporulation protein A, partial [Limnochordia bacterium]|nr:stage IV sporulation protein A [Limnochordia bacterium]
NSITPEKEETKALARSLEEKYNVSVVPIDCLRMTQENVMELMHRVLYEFPVREIAIRLPQWVDELAADHKLSKRFGAAVFETVDSIHKLRDVTAAVKSFGEYESIQSVKLATMDLGSGKAVIDLLIDGSLFYQVLQEMTGFAVEGDHHLLRLMQELSTAKKEYDIIATAFNEVKERGYGIVSPRLDDITFDEPELIKKGNRFGVRLKASAPSFHLIRASIVTEVTPFVGTEKQGEEMVRYLSEEFEADPSKIWSSDFLGKSLQELIQEGISSKLNRMPDHAQEKLQETLSKIINEGSGGLICIIL